MYDSSAMTTKRAKFRIGQLINNNRFNYRGVIVDVDPVFSGSEEWYQQLAVNVQAKNQPWYHVLVDQAYYTTYVAESYLDATLNHTPIDHPMINQHFSRFDNGIYIKEKKQQN